MQQALAHCMLTLLSGPHLHQARHTLEALGFGAGGPALRLLPRAAPALLVPAAKEALKQQAAQGGDQALPARLHGRGAGLSVPSVRLG